MERKSTSANKNGDKKLVFLLKHIKQSVHDIRFYKMVMRKSKEY